MKARKQIYAQLAISQKANMQQGLPKKRHCLNVFQNK